MSVAANSVMRVTHVFPTFRNLGGVEAVLRAHWEHDANYGIDSNFIILSERAEEPIERVAFLGFDGNTTTKTARRDFSEAIAKNQPTVCVLHGAWLMRDFADLDACKRRVLIVHGDYTHLLRKFEPWTDALGAISPPLNEKILQTLPEYPRERSHLLDCPIFPPQPAPTHQPLANRPIVIGYCGRLTDDEKRLDRAPAFVDALNQAELDYRMEFLGEGPLEPQLREKFRDNSRIIFHGRQTGARYWGIVRGWDFFVLFSDSEGMPISILETMDQGVLPIMPAISSGADLYARQLGPEFVYPPYDFSKACESIRAISSRSDPEVQRLRQRAAEIVSGHHAENYFAEFKSFLERIVAMPRRSTQTPKLPPGPLASMKFDSLAALSRFRTRFAGWLRK